MPELKDYVFCGCASLGALYSIEMMFQAKEAQTKYYTKGASTNEVAVSWATWFGKEIGNHLLTAAAAYYTAHKVGADCVKNAVGMSYVLAWFSSFVKKTMSEKDGEMKNDIAVTVVTLGCSLSLIGCFLPAFLKDMKK
uniref:Uncharacterized protein n=1 Tax=Karlodinium veneficum TaxID=407301 RepID=A7WPY7_KARVE|nr:unknown [Karlodinium veneficum]